MSRSKKTRSLRGKLGKTGSKEQMKEQKKALKAKSVRKFEVKKSNQRKEQAKRKLERLGLAPEVEEVVVPPRPRRFTFVPKTEKTEAPKKQIKKEESATDYLLDAFTEPE